MRCLTDLLLIDGGNFRKQVDVNLGFPKECKAEKARVLALIVALKSTTGLEAALAAVRELPPTRYTNEEWRIVRACLALLRRAVGELQVVFAEAAAADYTEVAQIALSVLRAKTSPLLDEHRQRRRRHWSFAGRRIPGHEPPPAPVAGSPDRRVARARGANLFVVGDPMQSIYSFRDARRRAVFAGRAFRAVEVPNEPPLGFDSVALSANFRTAAPLVGELNEIFAKVFEADDGSGVRIRRSAAISRRFGAAGPLSRSAADAAHGASCRL